MGISVSSDLILDVMRNADPSRVGAATAKLKSIEASDSNTSFAQVLDGVDGPAHRPPEAFNAITPLQLASPGRTAASSQDANVEFERMVLRNLLESLLPDPSSGAFGGGSTAGVWRSMAADQLAGLYASTGGVGIAASLRSPQDVDVARQGDHWPYFSTDEIKAYSG